jgi:hypothetical protein
MNCSPISLRTTQALLQCSLSQVGSSLLAASWVTTRDLLKDCCSSQMRDFARRKNLLKDLLHIKHMRFATIIITAICARLLEFHADFILGTAGVFWGLL